MDGGSLRQVDSGLLERGSTQEMFGVVRRRPSLFRKAEPVGVEEPVVILIVENGEGIRAWRQPVEGTLDALSVDGQPALPERRSVAVGPAFGRGVERAAYMPL